MAEFGAYCYDNRVKKKLSLTLTKTLPYILLIGGAIGVFSSFILTIENIQLIEHPNGSLICDLNPIISCGSVMKTPQSSVFGFPNSIIGLVGCTFIAVMGLALLSGAKFKRWFWLIFQASVTFAIGFVFWFQYQSFTNINALCPYCMVVWVVTIPVFLYTTIYNLREGHIKTPTKLKPVIDYITKDHAYVLALWYLAIIAMILNHFWYYWKTLV